MDPIGTPLVYPLDIFGTYDLPMCDTMVRNINVDSTALEGKSKV